jgi:hypothetical protein
MWVYADYAQVLGELKERNRFFRALTEIKEIALSNYNKELSPELEESLKRIAQKYDHALKPDTTNNK